MTRPLPHRGISRRSLLPLAAAGALATAVGTGGARALTTNEVGNRGGWFHSFWHDGGVSASMDLGDGGSYTLTWDGGGNVVAGRGWQVGSPRSLTYQASFQATGHAYLAVYGWTTDPLVEYYVVECWAGPRPGGEARGSVGDYDLYETTRTNAPSIQGTATFQQFWSVRRTPRTAGTVDTGQHFDAWAAAGMHLGRFDYLILATEGYQGSGKATVSLSGTP